jgi:hypothetical protein
MGCQAADKSGLFQHARKVENILYNNVLTMAAEAVPSEPVCGDFPVKQGI